jgi:EmrB/QacA subfamily drug resistance transporter
MTSSSIQIKKPFPILKLLILAFAIGIIVIDGTVLNVSIREIVSSLNTDIKSIQWAITLYSLVLAALTILGGKLGDIYGRKKMFILGATIFGIGSLVTALAPNIGTMILGWSVIEGIGAALMVPASSALIINNFEGKERGIAFGIYGATGGAAAAFGPLLGGFLTTYFSWRWAFGINVFIVAGLILGAVLKIKDKHDLLKNYKMDWLGVLLSSAGLITLTYGIIEKSIWGWLSVLLIGLFIIWERYLTKKKKSTLISLHLFKDLNYTLGLLIFACIFGGFGGFVTYGVNIFYQSVLGFDAFHAGLAFLPFSFGAFSAAPLSAKLANKFGLKNIVTIGLILVLIGNLSVWSLLSTTVSIWLLAPFLFIFGFGLGMFAAQVTNLILSSVPEKDAGEASGVNGTIREVGRSIGAALLGAIFLGSLTSGVTVGINELVNDKLISTRIATPVLQLAKDENTSALAFGGEEFLKRCPDTDCKNQVNLIIKLEKQQVTNASKQVLLYATGFFVLALAAVIFLPKVLKKGENS